MKEGRNKDRRGCCYFSFSFFLTLSGAFFFFFSVVVLDCWKREMAVTGDETESGLFDFLDVCFQVLSAKV